MNGHIIPPFNFQEVVLAPWSTGFESYGWPALMGFLVAAGCGVVGNYLILRRMALVGDAISHSVLPGLAIAFLLAGSRGTLPMFVGAVSAGLVTTLLIEFIHKRSRVKQDAAIGIAFSSLFAIGVILISVFAAKVDLDQECVLYGEIGFVGMEPPVSIGGITLGPPSVVRMGCVLAGVVVLVAVFYKELLISSFDPGVAGTLGVNTSLVHYGLMAVLSVVVVSAFEAAGAILVVAMLIIPGATASLLSDRLPRRLILTVIHAAFSSLIGIHLSIWLNCSMAAAMVVSGMALFCLAWLVHVVRSFTRTRLARTNQSPDCV